VVDYDWEEDTVNVWPQEGPGMVVENPDGNYRTTVTRDIAQVLLAAGWSIVLDDDKLEIDNVS